MLDNMHKATNRCCFGVAKVHFFSQNGKWKNKKHYSKVFFSHTDNNSGIVSLLSKIIKNGNKCLQQQRHE